MRCNNAIFNVIADHGRSHSALDQVAVTTNFEYERGGGLADVMFECMHLYDVYIIQYLIYNALPNLSLTKLI